MSDDRVIDFNELKNKVKDTDVDKFEQYIYNLYFSVMDKNLLTFLIFSPFSSFFLIKSPFSLFNR